MTIYDRRNHRDNDDTLVNREYGSIQLWMDWVGLFDENRGREFFFFQTTFIIRSSIQYSYHNFNVWKTTNYASKWFRREINCHGMQVRSFTYVYVPTFFRLLAATPKLIVNLNHPLSFRHKPYYGVTVTNQQRRRQQQQTLFLRPAHFVLVINPEDSKYTAAAQIRSPCRYHNTEDLTPFVGNT